MYFTPRQDFLHDHDNVANRESLIEGHVVVDRKDWIIAKIVLSQGVCPLPRNVVRNPNGTYSVFGTEYAADFSI